MLIFSNRRSGTGTRCPHDKAGTRLRRELSARFIHSFKRQSSLLTLAAPPVSSIAVSSKVRIESLVKLGITFATINLLSALLATSAGDWYGLYILLVSGPVSGILMDRFVAVPHLGFSQPEIVCVVVAFLFSGICSPLPKRYLCVIAGSAWVIAGFLIAGLKGVFS